MLSSIRTAGTRAGEGNSANSGEVSPSEAASRFGVDNAAILGM